MNNAFKFQFNGRAKLISHKKDWRIERENQDYKSDKGTKKTNYNSLEFERSNADSNLEKEIKISNEIVYTLNRHAFIISNEISNELKDSLPLGLKIEVEIEFSSGSIEWAGIVCILDWMARLGSSVGLLDYIKKAIEFSVNRIIRKHLMEYDQFKTPSTGVILVPELADSKSSYYLTKENHKDKFQSSLLVINTVLLLAILILTII